MSSLPEEFYAGLKARKLAESTSILWVSVPEQRLRLFRNGLLVTEYGVSTARNGVGCLRDSYQTPTGLHRIAQKIGDSQPVGMIFKERRATGVRSQESGARSKEDLILTRILWLEGLEPGVNQGGDVDSFSRYIYIHGTNHEAHIGQPASHGCVRMCNEDVVKLFDSVEIGSLVWIR